MIDPQRQGARAMQAAPPDSSLDIGVEQALEHLARCVARGYLRRLDAAFASFLAGLDAGSGPALPVAAALLSRMESQGHTFLPIAALVGPDLESFGWPAECRDELIALWRGLPNGMQGWLDQLGASATVMCADPPRLQMEGQPLAGDRGQPLAGDTGQPLVLQGTCLYLRRFWRDGRTVDEAVHDRCLAHEAVDTARARAWIERLFSGVSQPADGARGAVADQAPPADAASCPAQADPSGEPDWQRIACALALRGRLTIVTGGPGTGKTYTAARLLALLFAMSPSPERLRIALAAPTGKAAARLRQSIDRSLTELQQRLGDALDLEQLTRRIGGAQTLHALLGSRPDSRSFRHHAGNRLDADVVIVDEASMIHLEMMAALLQALAPQARLVLLGDKDQLASVEPGAVLGDLCADAQTVRYSAETVDWLMRATGERITALTPASASASAPVSAVLAQQTVMLRRSRRFDGPIGALARAVNAGSDPRRPARLIAEEPGGVLWRPGGVVGPSVVCEVAVNGRPGAPASYRDYCRIIAQRPAPGDRKAHEGWARAVLEAFDRFRVLCAIREGAWGVEGLNQAIEHSLAQARLLAIGGAPWYVGRPVMVTRNDRSLGVFNGDVGITLPAHDNEARLKVHFLDGEVLRAVSVTRLSHVETAYAMTVHKSQGSEFEHTLLVLPARGGGSLLTRELVYTGITRARKALSLVAESDDVLERAVARVARAHRRADPE